SEVRRESGARSLYAFTMPAKVFVSAPATKLSVLSSINATRGSALASVRRENSGGVVSTPFIRPVLRWVRGTATAALGTRSEPPRLTTPGDAPQERRGPDRRSRPSSV